MPAVGFRVQLTELTPTTHLITFIGDLGAASTHVIRQALADHIGPGRQLLVDLSRADRVERTASALPGQCVVITGGRQLPGSVSTASTIDEARAILAAQGHPLPVVEDSERTTSELDIRTLRNRALIADALDIIQQRYDQPTAEDAFALLGQASQRHNVPVRILAAAVLRVPAPKGTTWFPGRLKAPQPPLSFPAGPAAARTVRNVLRSLLTVVMRATDANSGDAQSVAPLDDGLVLESQQGMPDELVRDFSWIALADSTPCTRAYRDRAHVDADITTTETISEEAREALLSHGIRRMYSTPLLALSGRCLGVISTHHADTAGLHDGVVQVVDRLATETGRWLYWHRKTVVFDALERLHQLATAE